MYQSLYRIAIIGSILFCAQWLTAQAPFITTWQTDNPGTSCNSCITIPTSNLFTYNYDVDCDNDVMPKASMVVVQELEQL